MIGLSKHTRTRLVWRNGKKVREHRWIMSRVLGRVLREDEDVHHLNHDPLDNRILNLEVKPRAEHIALHAAEKQTYPDIKSCAWCGSAFKVNPRKRKRNKTCGPRCASEFRAEGRRRQAAAERRAP